MSENLDLVRSIYAAWQGGDFGSTDWACPDIEFEIVGGPDPGRWTGLAGMADGWRQWLAAWDGYHAKAEELRELDSERVLVLGRMSGSGKTSGVVVETEFANLLHVRDHKISRLCLYSNRDRALADLGQEE
ncbi:MAG TPA: nuclear transport factor 2 family protein [Solirubrobacteraceae bacterium]|jgi:ketosteroid isomerase-like protein|nr:nuclear transport factor 2 family protein [Solirubrobacteraceae bacterium]